MHQSIDRLIRIRAKAEKARLEPSLAVLVQVALLGDGDAVYPVPALLRPQWTAGGQAVVGVLV